MPRTWIAIAGLLFLAGCSGGGGDQGTQAPAPPTAAPTEFVAATSEGLWRGQPNGKGGVVFAYPNLQREDVLLGDGYVSYSRNEDIWTVNTDGTGNRALVNTPLGQSLHAVKGPWVFLREIPVCERRCGVEERARGYRSTGRLIHQWIRLPPAICWHAGRVFR